MRFSMIISMAVLAVFGSLLMQGCTSNDTNYWAGVADGLNKVDKK